MKEKFMQKKKLPTKKKEAAPKKVKTITLPRAAGSGYITEELFKGTIGVLADGLKEISECLGDIRDTLSRQTRHIQEMAEAADFYKVNNSGGTFKVANPEETATSEARTESSDIDM
jgi:hypothetical protein